MKDYSHPILQIILLDDHSSIKRRNPSSQGIEIFSEREGYIYRCSKGIVILASAIEKAAYSIELLNDTKRPLRNSKMNHAKQIQFAIENYFIRSASVYDRALIFVANLLDLGISDDRIDHTDIVTNQHVKLYALDKLLKDLNRICREFSDERNAIIHHRSYSNEKFDSFAMVVSANELSVQAGKRRPFSQSLVRSLVDDILLYHTSEYEEHLSKIKIKLDRLLDAAAIVYKIRKETYSDNFQDHSSVDESHGSVS